jgi:hypothetical protein
MRDNDGWFSELHVWFIKECRSSEWNGMKEG